jgi:hypothetical protein
MRINRPASLFITLSLLASVVVGYSTTASAAPSPKALGYWTQERLDSAQPIELVVDQKTGIGKIQVNPAAGKTAGGGTSSTGVLKTTDWPQGAPIAQTAVGKVFFTVGTSAFVCSGALVSDNDPNRAIVLTAGHCVWDDVTGAFVSNFTFFPNYDSGAQTGWTASALVARQEFTSQPRFNDVALANDFAFAVLLPGGVNPPTLPDVSFQGVLKNSYDLKVDGFISGYTSYAFGYPAGKPFNGLTLKYAGSPIFLDPYTRTTWGMSSSMTGGASGGPWLSNGTSKTVNAVTGKLSSLNSYKYNNDSTKMYGPKFDQRTQAAYNAAVSATSGVNLKVSN